MNPNEAFKRRHFNKYSVLMIICAPCGQKTMVSREVWIGETEIKCMNCGRTNGWELMPSKHER